MELRTKNGKIYYEREGTGPVLFFLHGNGENGQIYDHIVPYFKDEYTVIRMDTRGHGRSDLGEVPLTFRQIAEDVIGILDQESVQQATLVGFSDGGNLALYTAAHHPERIRALATMGANYEVEGVVDFCTAEMYEEKERLENLPPSAEKTRRKAVLALMLEELDLREETLLKISCPVLVIAGERDVIKEEHTLDLGRLTHAEDVIIVPNGEHDFFMREPLALVEPVKEFVSKHKL